MNEPINEAFSGTPGPYIEGFNTCGTGTCAAVERFNTDDPSQSLGCVTRDSACTGCDSEAACASYAYRGRVFRLCAAAVDFAGAVQACAAVGMALAESAELNSARHSNVETSLAGTGSLPFRLADDPGDASAHDGFVCSREYNPADYYEHGQYSPAYLGDWSTLGAGHPDLTTGNSLVDNTTNWLNVVMFGSMTNPWLNISRKDLSPVLCGDTDCPAGADPQYQCKVASGTNHCQLALDNSYYGGLLQDPIESTIPIDRLIIRGPNGQASCSDYDDGLTCHETTVPALRVRWHVNNPNKTDIPGLEGTVLFTIDHIPNVVIDEYLVS